MSADHTPPGAVTLTIHASGAIVTMDSSDEGRAAVMSVLDALAGPPRRSAAEERAIVSRAVCEAAAQVHGHAPSFFDRVLRPLIEDQLFRPATRLDAALRQDPNLSDADIEALIEADHFRGRETL